MISYVKLEANFLSAQVAQFGFLCLLVGLFGVFMLKTARLLKPWQHSKVLDNIKPKQSVETGYNSGRAFQHVVICGAFWKI